MDFNPELEQSAIMAWLDRRLEWADKGTLPVYVRWFKDEWQRTFGTLDNIPQEYKDKVTDLYNRLKAGESGEPQPTNRNP